MRRHPGQDFPQHVCVVFVLAQERLNLGALNRNSMLTRHPRDYHGPQAEHGAFQFVLIHRVLDPVSAEARQPPHSFCIFM